MTKLANDTNWKKLILEQQNNLLQVQGLTEKEVLQVKVANTDDVLSTLDNVALPAFKDRMAAIESRFNKVLVAAAKLMESKA